MNKNTSPGLTKDGKDWLIMALDPNHDSQIDYAGYPDSNSAHTIVKKVVKEYQIGNGGAAGNFDLHIFTLPELVNGGTSPSPNFTTATYAAGTDQVVMDPAAFANGSRGPVVWSIANPGTPTTPTAFGFAPLSWGSADFDDQLNDGSVRVVGFAIEAINTTAELYKQGSVTCYEMPQFNTDETVDLLTQNLVSTFGNYTVTSRQPPSQVSEATLLPGSTKWPAAEGAYAPVFQYSVENELSGIGHNLRLFRKTDNLSATTISLTDRPFFRSPGPPEADPYPPQSKPIPFNTKGIYFTGLSNQSTITLVVTMILEIAPAYGNLVSLSRPSPILDWEALKIYSHVTSRIDVATKSKNNASGDWFRYALKLVKTLAPVVGGAFGPEGKAIGVAVAETANILLPLIPADKRKGAERSISARRASVGLSNNSKPNNNGLTAGAFKVDRSRK